MKAKLVKDELTRLTGQNFKLDPIFQKDSLKESIRDDKRRRKQVKHSKESTTMDCSQNMHTRFNRINLKNEA